MCIANGSIRGLLVVWGFIGSSYVMVYAVKWARTCVSENGPMCGRVILVPINIRDD
jgi:hypothetical protein